MSDILLEKLAFEKIRMKGCGPIQSLVALIRKVETKGNLRRQCILKFAPIPFDIELAPLYVHTFTSYTLLLHRTMNNTEYTAPSASLIQETVWAPYANASWRHRLPASTSAPVLRYIK